MEVDDVLVHLFWTEKVISELSDLCGWYFMGILQTCKCLQFIHQFWSEVPFLTQLWECVLNVCVTCQKFQGTCLIVTYCVCVQPLQTWIPTVATTILMTTSLVLIPVLHFWNSLASILSQSAKDMTKTDICVFSADCHRRPAEIGFLSLSLSLSLSLHLLQGYTEELITLQCLVM